MEAKGWDTEITTLVVESVIDRIKWSPIRAHGSILFTSTGITPSAQELIDYYKAQGYDIQVQILRYKPTIVESIVRIKRKIFKAK